MSTVKPKSFWKKPEGVTGAIVLGGLLAGPLAAIATAAEPLEATATIDAEQPLGVISKHLYGHFAEHLGRCIACGYPH